MVGRSAGVAAYEEYNSWSQRSETDKPMGCNQLPLFALKGLDHRLDVTRGEKPGANVRILKESGQGGEQFHVTLLVLLRSRQKGHDVHRLSVDGIELNTRLRDPDCEEFPSNDVLVSMGNRNPSADSS